MDLANNRDYIEKRDFIRMKIDTPAKVTVTDDQGDFTGICRDLSGGGMSLDVEKVVPVGTEIRVVIASDHGHNPILKARAKVTRVEADHSGRCTLGVQIIDML